MWRRVVSVCLLLVILSFGSLNTFAAVQQSVGVLIDPGHGGMDGGAVAEDGTLEKHINLAISLRLRDLMKVLGMSVSMTRDSDVSIHSSDCTTIRQRKVSDMNNRLSLYRKADTVISIHQNMFSQEKYRGAQVFYSRNHADSAVLAQEIQNRISAHLQTDNTRQPKKATDGVYLLYHSTTPTVLVECGFLSNYEELHNLCDPTYQTQVAMSVLGGYLDYICV